MTPGQDFEAFWTNVAKFLNQSDLLSLGRTNKTLHNRVCRPALYETIVISKSCPLRSEKCFLDAGVTYVSGFRSLKRTADQNDIFLFDRIERLLESSSLHLIGKLVIQQDTFDDHDEGIKLLQRLVDRIIEIGQVQVLDIRDNSLFDRNYSKVLQLPNLIKAQVKNLDDINKLQALSSIKSLELTLTFPNFISGSLSSRTIARLSDGLQELVVNDVECSSLRLFQYFQMENVKLSRVSSLKFNHVHGIHDYSKTMRELTNTFMKNVFNLSELKSLELEVACEADSCNCLDEFLQELAPCLAEVHSIGLIEKTFVTQGDHYTEENWDLAINRFILNLPRPDQQLKILSVRHNPPLNGLTIDSVEGNYVRRRTLYENVLPKLTNLQGLIAPTFLQSISAYEILVCDLLWNGCECDFCEKVLQLLDTFIMNHQFYNFNEGCFKDIIPTVFFAYSGDALARRFLTEIDWDIKAFTAPPVGHIWNLHGYENVRHFDDFECLYDESVWPHLAKVIMHFFNSYMDSIVKLLPNLKRCILSGIYYSVQENSHYTSIYD
ncbi:LAMI_0G00430g1_1 [Lachancea mirantina]|uniref:LAMI_0G00430g1_1 n=1 Tax=Lachancea mirantina TaxID=1230905 RepID=A0A1G4K750_9SACH|nr:LAMI_0G00430g1_1 [Lachancea mirantina]